MWVAIPLYKNLLLYAMLAGASIRVLSAAVLAAMGQLNLPSSLVILSLIIAFLGFVLGIKRVVSGVRLVELVLYQAVADIGAVVSMIALHFYMVDIPLVETLVTGSVLSILASIVLLALALRTRRYITIHQQKEQNEQQVPAKAVSVPAHH